MGKELWFCSGSQLEKFERKRKEGFFGDTRFAQAPITEMDEAILRGEEEGDNAFDPPRQFKKGGKDTVENVERFLSNLTEMGNSLLPLYSFFEIGIEEGKSQYREKKGAIGERTFFVDLCIELF